MVEIQCMSSRWLASVLDWSGGAFWGEGLGYTDLFTVEIVGCGFFCVDVGIALIADEEVEVVKKGSVTIQAYEELG